MDIPDLTFAALLREAAAAHHDAFAATDGYDPEWPRWYAEYLEPQLRRLGWRVETGEIADELRRVDEAHRSSGSAEAWPEFYARWFAEKLAR